ncbi:hypothetical protein [Streptomyces sp. NPDC058268]|uniref:hypothetical protein n=1 Tax=Streptomyces sp. NPDC058268 TaxID=3346413 RepID=UPI0036F0D316
MARSKKTPMKTFRWNAKVSHPLPGDAPDFVGYGGYVERPLADDNDTAAREIADAMGDFLARSGATVESVDAYHLPNLDAVTLPRYIDAA